MIEVEVLFFARARELAGTDTGRISLAHGSTVAAASIRIAEIFPDLKGLLRSCRFAVDEELASAGDTISPGSVLAVIPPVSGG